MRPVLPGRPEVSVARRIALGLAVAVAGIAGELADGHAVLTLAVDRERRRQLRRVAEVQRQVLRRSARQRGLAPAALLHQYRHINAKRRIEQHALQKLQSSARADHAPAVK